MTNKRRRENKTSYPHLVALYTSAWKRGWPILQH